jgi:hypothetical protein
VPTARAVVYVVGDTARIRAVLRNGGEIAVIRGTRLAAWVAQPQFVEKLEPLATLVEDRAPIVSLCRPESSWRAVGRHYLNDIADALANDDATVRLSATLTAGATSDADRIARIARYVQQQIHYKAIEFGPRALRPDRPAHVLAQRYGDCKDHALLVHQLLAAAGITNHLALVNTSWRIEPELPSLGQFNHMVVQVPGLGEGWLLDATDKYLRLDRLPANGLWHSRALVLDPGGPYLLAARDRPPEGSYELSSERTIEAAGTDLSVEETLTMDGYAAAEFREWLAGTDTSEQIRRMQNFLAAGSEVQVSAFRCNALAETSKPAVATFRYTVKNGVEDRPGGSSAAIPAFLEHEYLVRAFVQDRRNASRDPVPAPLQDPDPAATAQASGRLGHRAAPVDPQSLLHLDAHEPGGHEGPGGRHSARLPCPGGPASGEPVRHDAGGVADPSAGADAPARVVAAR